MKKSAILALVAAAITVSCSRLDYDDYYMYESGGIKTERIVENLEIEWVKGYIDIQYHDAPYVEVYDDAYQSHQTSPMYHWLDGTTLHIKFCRNNERTSDIRQKTLTVRIPSGKMLNRVDIESVSGDIKADIDCRDFVAETVSGNVSFLTLVNPTYVNIETVSGSVYMALPENGGGCCKYETISGMLYCDFKAEGTWKHFDFGTGKGTFDIETVSGVLEIAVNK